MMTTPTATVVSLQNGMGNAEAIAAVAGTAPLPPTSAANLAAAPATAGLPASLSWTSSGPLIIPVSDAAHDLVAVKDPTVVRYNDRWHVYASSVARGGWRRASTCRTRNPACTSSSSRPGD